MGLEIDTSVAEAKFDRVMTDIRPEYLLTTKREAKLLQTMLRNGLPRRTGRLHRSIEVEQVTAGADLVSHQVVIRRRDYPGFFYAIMFSKQIRRITNRFRSSSIRRMKRRITDMIVNAFKARFVG